MPVFGPGTSAATVTVVDPASGSRNDTRAMPGLVTSQSATSGPGDLVDHCAIWNRERQRPRQALQHFELRRSHDLRRLLAQGPPVQ